MTRELQVSFRSPFEVFLLVACVAAGVAGFVNPDATSPAVSRILPWWLLISWYAALIVGGLCALAGTLLDKFFGLYIERIGLTLIVGICSVYGVGVLTNGGYPFIFAAMTVIAFAIACLARLVQIQRELRVINRLDGRP